MNQQFIVEVSASAGGESLQKICKVWCDSAVRAENHVRNNMYWIIPGADDFTIDSIKVVHPEKSV